MNENITRKLFLALQIMKLQQPHSVNLHVLLAGDFVCGTVACILGHCALSGLFPSLRFVESLDPEVCIQFAGKNYRTADFDLLGAEVFGISVRDAELLFGSRDWPSGPLDRHTQPDDFDRTDRGLAVARLEYAIERYSKGEPLVPEVRF